jgi:type II secretory pathway component PulF
VHVPAHRALRLLADGTLNPWFRDRVRKAADLCEQGVPLADALDQVGLDRRAAWFARGAANAPDLSEALARLAEDCRTQTSWAAAVAGRLLPPVVVLCIGIVVGTTVLSLFLPLIKLMNSLGG